MNAPPGFRLVLFAALVPVLACAATGRHAAPPAASPVDGRTVGEPSILTSVDVEPREIDPAAGQSAVVRWSLSEPAIVDVRIYDGDDLLVRTLRPPGRLPAGEHTLSWDGRDDQNRIVPSGAYVYTVGAVDRKGALHLVDPTDETQGRRLKVEDGGLDPRAGLIRYSLPEPGRVRIRIGLRDGGPHLRTLVDWEPRSAGLHEEPWDGLDASGEVDLREHPRATVGIRAFSLARNSIVVRAEANAAGEGGPAAGAIATASNGAAPVADRERRARVRPGVGDYLHAGHPRSFCHEPALTLEFPEDLSRDANGVPVARGEVPVRLTVAPRDEAHLLDARFEIVVFVDDVFFAEEEEGYNPFTLRLDAAALGPGSHTLTVNLVTLDDHLGVATGRFVVE